MTAYDLPFELELEREQVAQLYIIANGFTESSLERTWALVVHSGIVAHCHLERDVAECESIADALARRIDGIEHLPTEMLTQFVTTSNGEARYLESLARLERLAERDGVMSWLRVIPAELDELASRLDVSAHDAFEFAATSALNLLAMVAVEP